MFTISRHPQLLVSISIPVLYVWSPSPFSITALRNNNGPRWSVDDMKTAVVMYVNLMMSILCIMQTLMMTLLHLLSRALNLASVHAHQHAIH